MPECGIYFFENMLLKIQYEYSNVLNPFPKYSEKIN